MGLSQSWTGPVPANRKVLVKLMEARSQSTISYSAKAEVSFTIKFEGALRPNDNALASHPTTGGNYTATFGNASTNQSGFADILDQFDHSFIPGYPSAWDMSYVLSMHPMAVRDLQSLARAKVGGTLTGTFTQLAGSTTTFIVGPATPL
jgi:hypothetical protein